jgi:hypothetical protein
MSAPIAYDPPVLRGYAQRLYRQARMIVVVWPVLGFAAGFVLVGSFGTRIGVAAVLGVSGLFALVTLAFARTRATALRGQAQLALCMALVEERTSAPAARRTSEQAS